MVFALQGVPAKEVEANAFGALQHLLTASAQCHGYVFCCFPVTCF